MPEISVIVPVFNVEKYLPCCINSILNQTLSDFELILIDDGSTDASGTICDEYAKHDNRIIVIHKQNGGVSSARNTGMREAKGQYIMFCDSDDFVEPQWCEMLLRQIKLHPRSWCFCGCNITDALGNVTEENCVIHRDTIFEEFPISKYYEVFETNYSALLWIRIFKLDVIREYNISFDEKLSVSEDVLFNLHYGAYCDSFSVVNLPLYNHRMYYNNESEHLDGRVPKDSFYLNREIYRARKIMIDVEHMKVFATEMFYQFIEDIRKIANDKKLSKNIAIERLKEVLHSNEFKDSMRNANLEKESIKLIILLKIGLTQLVYKIFRKE